MLLVSVCRLISLALAMAATGYFVSLLNIERLHTITPFGWAVLAFLVAHYLWAVANVVEVRRRDD